MMCKHDKFTWRLAWFRTCEQCYEPEEVVIVKRELAAAIAAAPTDIALLLAEVRRLRCCGNCRKQQYDGMDYFCEEDNCEKYSLWEAAGNG